MRLDRERLQDIIDAATELEPFALMSFAEFQADRQHIVYVAFHLQIIGEAASKLSQAVRSRTINISWDVFRELRNEIVHEYFDLNAEELWNLLSSQIPTFVRDVRIVLESLP